MIVLSIDQSTTSSGWCICEINSNFKVVGYGFCKPKGTIDERILETWNFFENTMNEYQLSLVLVEGVYCSTNKKTYSNLSRLLGGLEELGNIKGVDVIIMPPSEWRKLLNVPPRTKRKELKKTSKQFVFENFNLEVSHDISDSICMALYYFLKQKGEIQ